MSLFSPLMLLLQEPASDATRESWRLLEMPAAWVVVLVLLPAAFLVAFAAYWREGVQGTARSLLVGLRFCTLLLLLLILFRPVQVKHQENVKQAEVVVLVDDSASMRRRDAYAGDAQMQKTLGELSGRSVADSTRLDLVASGLENKLLPTFDERGYTARMFRFADGFAPLTKLAGLDGRGHSTHLGDALTNALTAHRGRHVTDVVVLSDGRSNGGTPTLDAAAAAAAEGIPVHTVVVGDTRPERNLLVELVEAPASVLEGDEIAVSARVHFRGADEASSAQLVLEELPAEGSLESPRPVADEQVPLESSGERVVLVAPPHSVGHSATERRFRIAVRPLAEETLVDDNSVEFSVRVTPEKIRVLYVDGYPRWEYRFLNRMLKRADERIRVQCYLVSATPNFVQESSAGMPGLRRVPTDRRELLDNYDVIILGDVNPYAISPDPAVGEEFVESLFEFVERGGGLCLIAGEYENPKALSGTELTKLLPIALDPTGSLTFEGDSTAEFRPTLEDPMRPHEIVRLHPDVDVNRRLWEEDGGLRGFYWYYPIAEAKPSSQVLLRHPAHSNRHGERYPLLVAGYYPSGRTLFLGIDSTWRWRYRYVDRYHERFWRNAVRWLALGRLRSGDRRYGLEPLRNEYALDERVTLEARILDEDYRPSEADEQEAFIVGPEGTPRELDLTSIPGRAGLFRGTFETQRPGLHRAWIEAEGLRIAQTEFNVVLPSRENADPSPDPQALAALSKVTGGRCVDLAGLEGLLEEFPGGEERREPISSQLEDAWDHWGTLLLALALLSAEWILRKRFELI